MDEGTENSVYSAMSPDGSLRLTRWHGSFDPPAIFQYIAGDPTSQGFSDGGKTIHDFRNAFVDIRYQSARDLDTQLKRMGPTKSDKAVFLVSSNLEHGLARMYLSASDGYYNRSNVFWNEEDTLQWLEVDQIVYDATVSALAKVNLENQQRIDQKLILQVRGYDTIYLADPCGV